MKSRWIAAVVCLLYLSVSTLFAVHHHDSDDVKGSSQCAACAWHHEGQVEIPSASCSTIQPLTVAWTEEAAHSFFRELSFKIHPSRGPPVFPL